jgi:SH3-like domain-containing protein
MADPAMLLRLAPVLALLIPAPALAQTPAQGQPAGQAPSEAPRKPAEHRATHPEHPAEHPAEHHHPPDHPPAAHPEKPPLVHAPPPAHPPHPAHATAVPAPAAPPPVAAPAAPEKPPEQPKGTATGLPLPRFASLRTDDVNFRRGPDMRYPIDWVYKRRELPVEIEREFDVWRLVSDPDGTKGWVHQATLTGRRTFIVTGAERTLRSDANDTSAPVAMLQVGVIGRILACAAGADWCRLQVGDYRGWLKREEFWGTFPGEAVQP